MLKNNFNLRHAAKIVVACLAVVAMLTSCKEDDDSGKDNAPQLSEEDKILAELWDDAEQYAGGVPIQAQPEDDRAALAKGENTFIGYGINLLGGPTVGAALKSPLLKYEIYNDVSNGGGNAYIYSDPATSLVSTSTISEKFSEVYSSLDISAGLETGKSVPFFSGSVQAEYGSSSKVESEAKFYKYLYSATTKKQTIDVIYAFPDFLSDLVKDACIKLINDTKTTPEKLFNGLGTHIVLAGFTGGSASITGIYNSKTAASTQDISAALDFQTAWVNGEASTKLTDKQRAIAKETSITVNAKGGTVGELAYATIPTIGEKIEKWAKTVDNEPTLATITDAMPIWELATTEARQNELKNYFYAHADQISQALLGYFTKDAAPKTQETVVDGGVYYIRNKASGWSIVVYKNSKVNQESITLSSPSNTDQQKWVAVESPKGSDRFGFKSYYTGHYINISQGSVYERLMQFVHNGSLQPNELWRIAENPDGTVFIHSQMNDEFKIYAPNPTRTDVALRVSPAYTDNVKWKFEKAQ